MKLIRQPIGSRVCGQACVAILMDISLDESIARLGRKGATRLKWLMPVLAHRYRLTGDRLIPLRGKMCGVRTALLKVVWFGGGSHWVVKNGSTIYDPCETSPVEYEDYVVRIQERGRISSYFELVR